jgi:hypothetical protein
MPTAPADLGKRKRFYSIIERAASNWNSVRTRFSSSRTRRNFGLAPDGQRFPDVRSTGQNRMVVGCSSNPAKIDNYDSTRDFIVFSTDRLENHLCCDIHSPPLVGSIEFLARWCNWLTRRPLKAESTGSSPVRAIQINQAFTV